MTDFKAGDEVVCVDDSVCRVTGHPVAVKKGEAYIIHETIPPGTSRWGFQTSDWSVQVSGDSVEDPDNLILGYNPERFRKVQRRNLTEWLSQKTKFEEPKRVGENA